MYDAITNSDLNNRSDPSLPMPGSLRIPVVALGASLGFFLAATFVLCVLFDLWFPALAMQSAWAPLLPGFTWLSWQSFLLGLTESYAYGWYVALLFGPIFNFFAGSKNRGLR